ncbi:MAG: DUF3243 family protein [Peptococcaceae bacterium]|jgi:hypothetical protein|nr:DUF3243 domain-containing protein [Peptococcaceae bacterium]MDH7524183.1 DUF3243 family protein [Peptococcaceae bacterium]
MMNQSIERFPAELSAAIRDGLAHGLTDEMMIKGMVSMGNLLGHFVKPDNVEEALIKEIWENASEEEKNMLAGIVLRIGKKKITQH